MRKKIYTLEIGFDDGCKELLIGVIRREGVPVRILYSGWGYDTPEENFLGIQYYIRILKERLWREYFKDGFHKKKNAYFDPYLKDYTGSDSWGCQGVID